MAFTLSAPAAGTWPFALGFAFRKGDIPQGSTATASLAGLQVTVKNRWPDGSAKFAVLAGRAALAAATNTVVTLTATAAGGNGTELTTTQLRDTGVSAAIGCGSFGSVNWGGADWLAPFMTWVTGPEMSSWIYRKPIPGDAHLVAWLEVRLYATGAVEVLPWVENGYLLVASPSNRNASYTFALGGSERFSATIDLLNHQRTPLVSGAALSHWLSTDPQVQAVHDSAYLQATKLVPTYRATVSPTASLVTGLPPTYAPLQQGGYPGGMGSAGYHGSIGLLPEWDVLYLTTTAGNVRAAVERNAYSAGRYGIHFRDETTNRPPRFSAYPNLVLGGGNGVSGGGASSTNTYTPNATGASPPTYASTHHPSMGYLAALVSGRWYHVETTQFVATLNYLKNGNQPRQGAQGVFQSATGSNTTRGVGWAVRSLAQAASLAADDDPLAAELRASLVANINWYHARYVAQSNNPQGWIQPYSDYTAPTRFTTSSTSVAGSVQFPTGYVFTSDNYYNGWELVIGGEVRPVLAYVGATRTATVAPFTVPTAGVAAELRTDNIYVEASWMQDFVTAAFGYAKSLDVPMQAAEAQRLTEFFAWKARSIVGRFGTTTADSYLFRDAAQYTMAVAPSNNANWETGAGPWFANWGQLYDANFGANGTQGPRTDGGLRGGNFPETTSYWGNLQPALAYAVDHGVPGANEAYARMTGASNWATFEAGFSTAPVWSVRPR
jgi:hypothetical protein